MSVERTGSAFAGCFILISLGLSLVFSRYWLRFTAFIGANLLESAFTGIYPLAKTLEAFGATPGGEIFEY